VRQTNSPLRVSEDKTIKHPGEISKVEDVMELGRGGQQVLNNVFVKYQRARGQRGAHGHDALMKVLKT
jgi:hypothetical protein